MPKPGWSHHWPPVALALFHSFAYSTAQCTPSGELTLIHLCFRCPAPDMFCDHRPQLILQDLVHIGCSKWYIRVSWLMLSVSHLLQKDILDGGEVFSVKRPLFIFGCLHFLSVYPKQETNSVLKMDH